MKTLVEKRDALLRRREELLEEWARNKAASLNRREDSTDEIKPPGWKRVRITDILGELDKELDRLEQLIAEDARKDREEGPGKEAEALPELPSALQSRLDSVLRRLEACYPDHTVQGACPEAPAAERGPHHGLQAAGIRHPGGLPERLWVSDRVVEKKSEPSPPGTDGALPGA